ncbi:MAG: AbrB/MazE/SpoVT family DNA-binding domain-containing protein [Gemmatimonadales bacterium]|jgi:antitoxin MazE|nr:AbrB/MazE/SpoVT family DNA-binding domain-containing protein [Gemmatimonadales bacterium]MBP6570230.1 AbrB/MazE/SpoVT family DNA-binding domain-containing protein [Gemmatimonadales bacterium]MBP7620475.1 AbrB/MazE/SpoVT family DNA-binding domain-containing protein [Gemmatimonadales bacterium]MBP9899124.1 AbrB/MazE/SpoVT family DNA-binding domain-containing protein [Gemmatimonadales bacterium]
MISRVQKWGNSQGLPLPKALLAEAGLRVGSEVELVVKHGALVITPFQRRRGGHHLRTLVRRLPAASNPPEWESGPPSGREAW